VVKLRTKLHLEVHIFYIKLSKLLNSGLWSSNRPQEISTSKLLRSTWHERYE